MRRGAALPVLKEIVLLGAGHAHVGVLRRFGMRPEPGVRLTLITRRPDTPYSGMLPGQVAGIYGFDDTHIDTGPLCHFAGARLILDEAVGLDLPGRQVLCGNRPPVPYDLLSLDIGSAPAVAAVPGAAAHVVPVKPIDGFWDRFDALHQRVMARAGDLRIGVVGAGAGGVELMLSLERRLRRDLAAAGHDPARLGLVLVARSAEVLPDLPPRMRTRFAAVLRQRGIEVRTSAAVAAVEAGLLRLDDGSSLALDEILWTTQATPADWLRETGLALDAGGFIRVRPTLESVSHPGIFAAGDVAALDGHALPKSGVYAVRAGAPLADNLRRALMGRPLRPFRPQREALYLVSTGERHAIGTRNGIVLGGGWVWRLKDWIDRRFMRRFNALPAMPAPVPPPLPRIADAAAVQEVSAIGMRCGGCGAKIGATVLARALRSIVPVQRDDVLIGLDAPDDAAVIDTGGPRLTVQSVDYFRAIVDDPFVFGRIAATHALSDVYAMGAEPQAALAIATLPPGLESKLGAELSQLMAGANAVLHEAGCALVGGHTSEGAELALGFTVTGLVARDALTRKDGLSPGDALILTKPLGTGTLLAAAMQGKARGRWVAEAVRQMTVSNRAAADVLRRHGARAVTDVTGFGLLGHLVEMLLASGTDAALRLAALPLLDGARETLAMGIVSSLQPENLRFSRFIRDDAMAAGDPLFPALFDPQTSGGLLAAVRDDEAAACLASLHHAGCGRAAIIGSVLPRGGADASVLLAASGSA